MMLVGGLLLPPIAIAAEVLRVPLGALLHLLVAVMAPGILVFRIRESFESRLCG